MAQHFYADGEDNINEDSINNYEYIFKQYIKTTPNLEEALNEMYMSTNISELKVKALKEDILLKSAEIVKNNFFLIKKQYPIITHEEAQIISSYNCISYDPDFSPYKILNKNLCEENRYEGIKKISKYFYIFLKALKKLHRYFINKNNYLYKCTDKKVFIQSKNNENRIIYKRGIIKIFKGFTSFSTFINKSYISEDKEINIESGTIFALYGNIYGYDISLFNSMMSDEIILEPEQKCVVVNVIPPNKNSEFINIRLTAEEFNNILPNTFTNYDLIYDNVGNPKLIKIVYKFPERHRDIKNKEYIQIFGDNFVKNNDKICVFIFENKEYCLDKVFDISKIEGDKLEIYLKGLEKVSNLSQMFQDCKCLFSCDNLYITSKITNISEMFSNCNLLLNFTNLNKWNTSNISDMSYLFYNCSKLLSLPDISKWDLSNVTDISGIFGNCSNLSSLPDISRWNTSKITKMNYVFYNCNSLKSLPDISKWNISNVTEMRFMFYGCSLLSSLSELSVQKNNNEKDINNSISKCSSLSKLSSISKWNTSNVKNLESLFCGCTNLLSLPDISKWNISNAWDISGIFKGCNKLKSIPDISKWNTSKIIYMNSIFQNCSSLLCLPDISKWDTSNVIRLNSIFEGCISLPFIPDISKWNTYKVIYMNKMFNNCKSLLFLPEISKWDTSNIAYMNNMFEGCSSLVYLPNISVWKIPNIKDKRYMFIDCLSLMNKPNI